MCTCLTHGQSYPQDGFCVYCGAPEVFTVGVLMPQLPSPGGSTVKFPESHWGIGAYASACGGFSCGFSGDGGGSAN